MQRKRGWPMEKQQIVSLIEMAKHAREFSYSPYSGYMVGAALLTEEGKVYTGCNVENAAYGPSNCAERTAIFKAVSEGVQDFTAIAIVGGKRGSAGDYAAPCGVCRQVMMEFCNPETMQVIVAKNAQEYKVFSLAELMPEGFGRTNLE